MILGIGSGDLAFDVVALFLQVFSRIFGSPIIYSVYVVIIVLRIKLNSDRLKKQQVINDSQSAEIKLQRSQIDTLQTILNLLLTSKQLIMWERFGLTEEEWLQLDEATRQKMLVQSWQVEKTPNGVEVLTLGEVATLQSMNEYLQERGEA